MSYYNPFKLVVEFEDGSIPIERSYDKGANDAVSNMSKAIDYYERKYVKCTISLYDYLNRLIIKQTVPAP